MALLPLATDITGAGVQNAVQKTNFAAIRNFLADLLGTDSTNKTAARAALGVPMKGYLWGMTLSNNATDAVNDIDFAAGECSDSTGAASLIGGAMTKQLDVAWAAGTGAGGRDTGSVANGTWHCFAILKNSDLSVDYLFSLSPTAPTMPTGYTYFRRIGTVLRASGSLLAFAQEGDYFRYSSPPGDITATTSGAAAVTRTMASLPTGIRVLAHLTLSLSTGASEAAYLSDLAGTDVTALANSPQCSIAANSSGSSQAVAIVRTNTSAQIRSRQTNGTGTDTLRIGVLGWWDTRGRVA